MICLALLKRLRPYTASRRFSLTRRPIIVFVRRLIENMSTGGRGDRKRVTVRLAMAKPRAVIVVGLASIRQGHTVNAGTEWPAVSTEQ